MFTYLIFLLCFVTSPVLSTVAKRNRSSSSPAQSSNCVLPPYPEHGIYVVENDSQVTPGQRLPSAQLIIACKEGYGVVGSNITVCHNGSWSHPLPKCVQFCKLDTHYSVFYNCNVSDSTEGRRACSTYERPGTVVTPECNKPNYYSKAALSLMRCNDGEWNYIAFCEPECGRLTPKGLELVIGGMISRRAEIPWHVAIYRKPNARHPFYEQICGGSLVTNSLVISAGHCFWMNGQQQPASKYAVAAGKLFRDWNHKDDRDVQKSELKAIRIPPLFIGGDANFQEDIALLFLETPFIYHPYIRPVCLSFDLDLNGRQLKPGHLGKVAGWGLTEKGLPSEKLKVVDLPLVSTRECIASTPYSFTEFITSDKICAGFTNGTAALCRGDSGGGLSFPEQEPGTVRYFLRGIASTAPRSEETGKWCNEYTVTTFTQVVKHEQFIIQYLNSTSPVPTDRCVLPPYPAHSTYVVTNMPEATPGQSLQSAQLNVSCEEGYGIIGVTIVTCVNGAWSLAMPECIRFCKLNTHPSVKYECLVNHEYYDSLHPCSTYEPPGTTIRPECNTPKYLSETYLPFMRCGDDGSWNITVVCQPAECGRVSPEALTAGNVSLDDRPALRGEVPWHVAIYRKPNKSKQLYVQVCAGSLVKNDIVLSAVQCFWNGGTMRQRASKYAAAAGKVFRDWGHDEGAQISDIESIEVPYRAEDQENEEDVAVLILKIPFVYNNYIKPVCLDFDFYYSQRTKELGKVAGWNTINEDQKHLEALKVISLTYMDKQTCSGRPPTISDHISSPRICAGYVNGTSAICRVDSGEGLSIPLVEDGMPRYYLVGIATNVALAQHTEDPCLPFHVAAFTRISYYKEFIKRYL